MKKIISILALVLAMTMVMSVSAFAAKEFSVDETAAAAKGVTLGTVDADSIEVTVPTTSGADYSILLVKGSTLPTVDSDIAYINQIKADAATETFEVLPLMSVAEAAADGNLMLYIGTNATNETLIAVPIVYDEEQAQYTLGDVDNNGSIGASDALATLKIVADIFEADTPELEAIAEAAADVNGDGTVGASDALTILKYVADLIPSFN